MKILDNIWVNLDRVEAIQYTYDIRQAGYKGTIYYANNKTIKFIAPIAEKLLIPTVKSATETYYWINIKELHVIQYDKTFATKNFTFNAKISEKNFEKFLAEVDKISYNSVSTIRGETK